MQHIDLKKHPFAYGVALKIQRITTELLNEHISPEYLGAIAQTAFAIADQSFAEIQPKIQVIPDCKKSCSWCCYSDVFITIPELRLIVDFFDEQQRYTRSRVVTKVHETTLALQKQGDKMRVEKLIPCSLLEKGMCSIYPIRPMGCRGVNSLSAITCEEIHGRQGHIESEAHQVYVYEAGAQGLIGGMLNHGFKKAHTVIELNQGLSYAYQEPNFFFDWCNQEYDSYPLGWIS